MVRNAQEAMGERQLMSAFSAVIDADPARARSDRAFRQKLLEQSLDAVRPVRGRWRRSQATA
jgi:hypothetical protein